MTKDKNGFLYPQIDVQQCVECGLCEKVCPEQNYHFANNNWKSDSETIQEYTHRIIKQEKNTPDAFIAYNKNSVIRKKSTSGGVFTAIANYVIEKKGWVYGVCFNKDNKIIHYGTQQREEIKLFRGSKYVQSNPLEVYSEIKNHLKQNKWVLYTGTPCQVAGLKLYLRKKYTRLITVDIFCHGVGSPQYWNQYLNFMERKYQSKIRQINFREKTYGYNSACMAVYFDNGKFSKKGHDDDLYWTAFSKCYILRPSCYKCKFKNLNHDSDFTIGDFWDCSSLKNKDFINANGCTLLLVHSQSGHNLLELLEDRIQINPFDLEKALIINGGPMPSKLISSSLIPNRYDDFVRDMHTMEIEDLVQKYMPLSAKQQIKCFIKPMLYRIGILDILKKIFKKAKK